MNRGPEWCVPLDLQEKAVDARYRADLRAAARRGAAFSRRAAPFLDGRGRFLVAAGAEIVIQGAGTRIEARKAARRPVPDDLFCPSIPNAVLLGMPPHWRFQDPAARRTRILIRGGSAAIFHENTFVGPGAYLTVNNGARFELGTSSYLGHDCNVNCRAGITIGEGTLIGQQSFIADYDGHPVFEVGKVPTGDTWAGASKPIRIGRGVWIGFRSMILKGALIGDGAIIGAGSVVTGSVPPRCAVAGNPARVVRRGVTWRRY